MEWSRPIGFIWSELKTKGIKKRSSNCNKIRCRFAGPNSTCSFSEHWSTTTTTITASLIGKFHWNSLSAADSFSFLSPWFQQNPSLRTKDFLLICNKPWKRFLFHICSLDVLVKIQLEISKQMGIFLGLRWGQRLDSKPVGSNDGKEC